MVGMNLSSTAVALTSYHRREAKEVAAAALTTPPSLMDTRRRRVTGMIHTFTNKQEIAGPLAALYLFRGSCKYSSAMCVRLPLSDVLKQLENSGDYSCNLVSSQADHFAVFTSTSHLDDYIYRLTSVSSWDLYEYKMRCYRRVASANIADHHRFEDPHPLSASHCIAYRIHKAVPVISGPRLPLFKEGMSDEQRELYAKLALTLFKPFRSLDDLLGVHAAQDHPWYSAYSEWEPHRTALIQAVMANINDYDAGRASENEAKVNEDSDPQEASSSGSDWDSSDDAYGSDDLALAEGDLQEDNFQSVFEVAETGDLEALPMQSFPVPSVFSAPVQCVLADFEQHHLVHDIAQVVASRHNEVVQEGPINLLPAEELKKWVGSSTSDAEVANALEVVDVYTATDRPTTINEIIDESLQLEQMRWREEGNRQTSPQAVPTYGGVSTVSRAFTLNQQQHAAFAIVAASLLRRWKVATADEEIITSSISDNEVERRQLKMFLGGEGGTGKSRVVGAIQELCRSWQRPSSVIVTTITGKATSIIGGRTLASFEMLLKSPHSHTTLRDVDCLIIDEVSMMPKTQLLRLDRLLRKAKRVDRVPFGGIHVILVGDFLQLPPVGADPLFINPSTKPRVSLEDFEGFNLWRQFETVIVLRETVRFAQDPEWGEGCSKARYGEWTPAFLEMINAGVVDQLYEAADPPTMQSNAVFVTPNNDTRSGVNSHFIASTTKLLQPDQFPIRVLANFKEALNRLSKEDVSYIMGLPNTSFGRMAPNLDLIRGMPVQITQNVRTKKGLANGTMGILHSVMFLRNTSFRRARDRRTNTTVLLPDHRPMFALVRLSRGANVVPITEGADSSLFPVFPDAEANKKTSVPLTPSSTGQPRTLSIKIQQFPFVCAVGGTIYKVQGETLTSMGVVVWKAEPAIGNRPQQVFLMVSRVVKRDGLVCLKPLTPAIAACAKPPTAAVEEDRRLAVRSEHTLKTFYDSYNVQGNVSDHQPRE